MADRILSSASIYNSTGSDSMHEPLSLYLIVLSLFAGSLSAQTALWIKVGTYGFREKPIILRRAEANAVREILKSPSQRNPWDSCADEPTWVDNVTFTAVRLSPGHKTVMVKAGTGCARGGQGANGAMWIVQLDGPNSRLLASPNGDFSGWPYSVQTTSSHGYRDIVLGWHMGGPEAGLTYFRFDGRSYRSISHASLLSDDNGDSKIVPSGLPATIH